MLAEVSFKHALRPMHNVKKIQMHFKKNHFWLVFILTLDEYKKWHTRHPCLSKVYKMTVKW